MRLWPPLWQDIPPSLFSTRKSPPPLVCFALLHAPFEPRYTYTTRSLVYGSRVCHTIESSSKGRVFVSLSLSHSLFFVHLRKKRRRRGGFSQEYILYFSKSTINFYRLPGDGYGERKKEEEEDGNFNSIRLVARWMDGRRERSTVARILEWPTSSSGWSKISMVVRYQLFEFSLIAYTDRIDWPKSDLSRRKFLDSVSGRENFMEGEYLWRIKVSRKLCSNWLWSFLNI